VWELLPEGCYQAGFVGGDNELNAVAGTELGKKVCYVGLGRGDADMKVGGDFPVGHAAPDQRHHFTPAVSDALDGWVLYGGCGPASELCDQAAGDAGGKQSVSVGHRS